MLFFYLFALVTALLAVVAYAAAIVLAIVLLPFRLIRRLLWPQSRSVRTITIRVDTSGPRQAHMTNVTPRRARAAQPAVPTAWETALFNLGRGVGRARDFADPDAAPRFRTDPSATAAAASRRTSTIDALDPGGRASPQALAPAFVPDTLSHPYFLEAERLFATWMAGRPEGGEVARRHFSLDHAPEPYLRFGAGRRCIFLTTNPGTPYDYQLHPDAHPASVFHRDQTYAQAAVRLGGIYGDASAPITRPAAARIANMLRIAAVFGCGEVMQVDALPWHSVSFSGKTRKVQELLDSEPAARRYMAAVRGFLTDQPVVLALASGVPGKRSGEGIDWKADLIGLDMRSATILPLESKSQVSQALFWKRDRNRFVGLFVNQGSDALPKRFNDAGQDKDAMIRSILN